MAPEDEALVAAARAARERAYAPYSEFAVGAALLCADGSVVSGCNVENGSYGLTICAERNAVFAAVASGRRTFTAIAVAGAPESVTSPCGACRQVMAEFAPELRVLYTVPDGVADTKLSELLPQPFVRTVP
jgi:cytidine deaminase